VIPIPLLKGQAIDMGSGTAVTPKRTRVLEDALAHLPCSTVVERRKGQTVYGSEQPSTGLYLIIEGKVKVFRISGEGRQVVIDIYQRDEFFGEGAFLGEGQQAESAVTLENTRLMSWTLHDIEEIAGRRPKLAVALLQLLAQRSADLGARLESFAVDNISQRLARSLMRFGSRLGQRMEDESVRMMPFTHELLAQYVGTSREIVTHYMNHLRRRGLLRYSRKEILLRPEALDSWLREGYDARGRSGSSVRSAQDASWRNSHPDEAYSQL
jgi:CRP-like cAMP-binding protein